MEEIWNFLSDEENRNTLAWIGGSAATTISALWIAGKTIFAKPSPDAAEPDQQPAAAADGGVGSGGNIRMKNSKITINSPDRQVPKSAWALGAAGLAVLAYAISQAGDTTCIANGVSAGDITGPTITVVGDKAEVDC